MRRLFKIARVPGLAILLLLLPAFSYGQEASSGKAIIRGSVQASNNEPVVNALILLLPSNYQPARSGPDGSFEIPSLPPGSYTLIVVEDGFVPWARHDIVLEQGETVRVQVRLEKSAAAPAEVAYESPTPKELKYYAKVLAILQEPGFCSTALPKGVIESYRFLWLRSFHPAVLIHLTIFDDERVVVTYKESDGASGYEINKLMVNWTADVKQVFNKRIKNGDKEVLRDLITAIRQTAEEGLWNQPYRLDDGLLHMDGAGWNVEGVRSTGCRLVHRWSSIEGDPLRKLANLIIYASGKRFYYDEVY